MPASSISLDSLSSPSPTPSPPPPRARGSTTHKAQAAHTNNKQAAPPHGLGSDSELSELTEEEQDTADKRDNAPNPPDGDTTMAGDDESAGGTSVGGGAPASTSTNASRRATQKTSSAGAKRGGGRKKRSSLVPAPMWGWAETYREEEEEEMSGPPKPMEEEEDEEEGDEADEEGAVGGSHSASTSLVRKAKGKKGVNRDEGGDEDDAMDVDSSTKVVNGGSGSPKNVTVGSDEEDGEEEEEEAESEEAESEKDKHVRIRRPKKSTSATGTDSEEQTESGSDEESEGERRPQKQKESTVNSRTLRPTRPVMRRGPLGGRKMPARKYLLPMKAYSTYRRWHGIDEEEDVADDPPSPKDQEENNTEDEEENGKEDEKEDGDVGGDGDSLDPSAEEIDPPEATLAANDYAPAIVSSAALKAATSPPKGSSRVVDDTGPLVEAIAPIAAAAAASSIMAGSGVIDPPSPTSTSSRSRSPGPVKTKDTADSAKKKTTKAANDDEDDDCDDPPVNIQPEKKEKPPKHVPPPLDINIDVPEAEGDGDNEPSGEVDLDEPENEPEQEGENGAEVEVEAEVEPEEPLPEDDLEVEMESDLQPAHRAEALDVLATIELKFALLRERVYVEKMEGLAWEEKLVNEGTHPELIHIQKELLNRRDKRLELASRKREYELANIAKKRRIHEDATWSWWKLARDELQTDMIAEVSRKRRRLERERRTMERPQPVRRVPLPPSEVPPAPSLRKIIKSFPFDDRRKVHNSQPTPKPGVYPELTGLSASEINADLEIFLSNRRGYDFRGNPVIGFPGQIATPLGFGGYDSYTDHMGNPIVPPGRMPPPQHIPQFAPQMHPPQGYAYSNPANGRMPPPPSGHGLGHGHPPPHGGPPGPAIYQMDEMIPVMPQVVPPHHYYGSQVNGGSYPEGVPPPGPPLPGPPGHHGRRSPSPMNGVSMTNGKQPHGGWVGPGMPPGAGPAPVGPGGYPGPGQARPKGEWVPGEDRRRDYLMGSEEEERDRMAMKDREQRERREGDREKEGMMLDIERERERHMQIMAHRQGPPPGPLPPQSMHQHVHGMASGQHPHIFGGHHHPRAPHHHHVVHHHHNQSTGPGGQPPGSAMQSPRAPREYGEIRPDSGHGHYPTEVINLSSGAKHGPPPPPRDDHPMSREQAEFREREKEREKERARISRRSSPVPGPSSQSQSQSQRQGSQGPVVPGPPPPPSSLESDRPIPTPFVMASTQAMQATSLNGTSSPRVSSGYDGHVRSPGHRFPSTGRSAPPTAGPSTPSAGPPPPGSSSASGVNREVPAISPPRRPPLPHSPALLNERERERERDRERERERDLVLSSGASGVGGLSNTGATNLDTRGSSNVAMPTSSPSLQRQRSPAPVRYGPPPPPPPSGNANMGASERERALAAAGGSGGSVGARSPPPVGYKMRPLSPLDQSGKSVGGQQPLVSPKILAGPGRAGTPVGSEGRSGPFTSPSARSVNGAVSGVETEEREKNKERVTEEQKIVSGPGIPPLSSSASANSPVTLPPPSKMSVPQMIDGH